MIVLFLLSGTAAVVGNFFLKLGINQIKGFDLMAIATSWQIILGFLLYGSSSILYLKLLSGVDVTKAYPALVGYMAVVILLLGAAFLKEPLTVTKVLGVLAIIGGIFLISRP